MAKHVDDMAFIHSCCTETNNHSPALFEINTGMSRMGFPCVGSWVTYGLGTESQNLPAFVAMYDTLGRGLPKGHAQNWGAGFLPGVYQGTALNAARRPIDNLYRSAGHDRPTSSGPSSTCSTAQPPAPGAAASAEAELAARIESFELAYRMQMAAPEALDVDAGARRRSSKLYGIDNPKCAHFAKQVPDGPPAGRARRAVRADLLAAAMENERSWDGHTNIADNHRAVCRRNRHAHRRPARRT